MISYDFCLLLVKFCYMLIYEVATTGLVYLDMLQQFFIPQLDEDDQEGRIHFQQDGAPPHYLEGVHEYLNTSFPGRLIGKSGADSTATSFPGSYTLEFFPYGDSLTMTIPGKTRCVLLHYDSSRRCTCSI
jgi:hypothetical protein